MTRRRLLLGFAAARAHAQSERVGVENVAPYYPTPMPVARQMLEVGELEPGELHYDLGSGDGRLVLLAAHTFAARSVGYEIEPKLVASSRGRIVELKLESLARIQDTDLFGADFSKPDLITVYLLPRALDRLRPLLEESMKKGSRVVSHDFAIPGWDPDETITLDDEPDLEGLLHTIYLYRR